MQPEHQQLSRDATITVRSGSHDAEGAADHDQPYHFGRRPRAIASFPFSTQQYARLLVLRSRAQAGLIQG